MTDDLYATDYLLWAERQAELLRAGRLSEIDALNLAEEVDDLARMPVHEIRTRLREMMIALVYLRRTTDERERARLEVEISDHQFRIEQLWSPSVAGRLDMAKIWASARENLLTLQLDPPPPEECPIGPDVPLPPVMVG